MGGSWCLWRNCAIVVRMENDPITYPTITLNDGQTYELKFRVGDIIRLKKDHGIEIGVQMNLKGIEGIDMGLKLLTAALAHKIVLTPEQAGDLIDMANFPEVMGAITEALGKVSARSKALLPTPADTTAPKPN